MSKTETLRQSAAASNETRLEHLAHQIQELSQAKAQSAEALAKVIENAGTVVWNGPVGVFEFVQFGDSTKRIAQAIADTKAFTLAGGGDTIAAIQKYDIYDKVSYISTAGGAFLEFLEGKTLPAVAMLEERAKG